MAVLSKEYQVVAIDQRGYNLSDKPKGQEQYDLELLVDDLHAVIQQLGRNDAIIVGHDWGARVAWGFAGRYPEMTRLLITCNGPNPRGIGRERAHNAEQQANTAYAQRLKHSQAIENSGRVPLFLWLPVPPGGKKSNLGEKQKCRRGFKTSAEDSKQLGKIENCGRKFKSSAEP
jgi:pimeloyl-ACP methyl ester carboxylesterase